MKNARARLSNPTEDWRVALAVHEDLRQMGMPRANLMLVGIDDRLQRLLELLSRDYREPVEVWTPGEPFVLPPVDRVKTLILRNVGDLSLVDQGRLYDWLDKAAGRTQVVSTSPEPLLPLVYAGAFLSSLYYRLNILYVEVPETFTFAAALAGILTSGRNQSRLPRFRGRVRCAVKGTIHAKECLGRCRSGARRPRVRIKPS